MNTKNISKAELADMCGVSQAKVKQWCNVDFYDELRKIGYKKNQKIFTPKQTKFLLDNLVEYKENTNFAP
jgi:predicted transcriptional regulator